MTQVAYLHMSLWKNLVFIKKGSLHSQPILQCQRVCYRFLQIPIFLCLTSTYLVFLVPMSLTTSERQQGPDSSMKSNAELRICPCPMPGKCLVGKLATIIQDKFLSESK